MTYQGPFLFQDGDRRPQVHYENNFVGSPNSHARTLYQPARCDSAPYGAPGAPSSPWSPQSNSQPTMNFPTPHLSTETDAYWPGPAIRTPSHLSTHTERPGMRCGTSHPKTRSTVPFPAPRPHTLFNGYSGEPYQSLPNPYDRPEPHSFPKPIHEEPEEISPISDTSSDDFPQFPNEQCDSGNKLGIDPGKCSMLVLAVRNMKMIEAMACKWFEQLPADLTPGGKSHHRKSLEQNVSVAIGTFRRDAILLLSKSEEIVQKYRNFIDTFHGHLCKIERSHGGKLQYTEVLEKLCSEIAALSSDITTRVHDMNGNLHNLAKTIESTKDEAHKKEVWGKILLGLEISLKVLEGVFGIGSAVTQLAPPVGQIVSVCLGGVAVGLDAAAELSKKVRKDYCDDNEFDVSLRYLRKDIPEVLEGAKESLTSFQAYHEVLNLEISTRKGMSLSASEASAARKTWREAGCCLDMVKNPTRHRTC